MAQPPLQPYWPSPPRAPGWQSPGAIVGIVVAVAFAVFFLIFAATAFSFGGIGVTPFFFAPFCGILIVIIVIIIVAASQGMGRPRIPPPPPIQQPMVPAGMQGPVALACPNCGAPPQNVDRFGVATCTYCNTRYLVR